MAKPDLAVYELIGNDDRMHLTAGDLLLVTPYDGDPDKGTVICRITDGFDPECNVYWDQVRELDVDDLFTAKFNNPLFHTEP